MSVKCQAVIEVMDKLAPRYLAEDWDNVGLLAGSPAQEINGIMVCLDVTEQVVDTAIANGVNMIIAHHPLIFKPLTHLRTDSAPGKLLTKVIKADLAVLCAHTNLDIANGGVNDVLARKLQLENIGPLTNSYREQLVKLVVFVPTEQVGQVQAAITQAGAGHIGNYSHCTFRTEGVGTFLPASGTNPFIGETGKLAQVPEFRLETILPAKISNRVIKAMLKSHPYEEVAYDLYPLNNSGREFGLGRIGHLAEKVCLADFARAVRQSLGLSQIRLSGDLKQLIHKVAVCGGSGAGLIKRAAFMGADALVTGDLKYHEAQDALALGIAVIDAGHYATEAPVVEAVIEYLRECSAAGRWSVDFYADQFGRDVFQVVL